MLIGYLNIGSVSPIGGISVPPLLFSLVAGFSIDTVLSVLERISAALRYEKDPPSDVAGK